LRHDKAVAAAAWSPDGTRIVTGSNDAGAAIWSAATGARLVVLRGHGDNVFFDGRQKPRAGTARGLPVAIRDRDLQQTCRVLSRESSWESGPRMMRLRSGA
jgi:hypothetical protein